VGSNPPNRFEAVRFEADPDWDPADDSPPRTQFLYDRSQTVITHNDSPDIPFEASLNPYRGCEHGCAYCYARPTHEFLGFSSGLDFETRILVKADAPALLRRELASPRWRPQPLALSGVTDPYQPVERRLRLTRRCLEVLCECRNPVNLLTKNHWVTRDRDLLGELARHNAVAAHLSITSLDPELVRRLEPRASLPALRLEAVSALAQAGVPVGVLVAPIIPGLNDHEIPAILEAAAAAGARWAGMQILRLPHAVSTLFTQWLEDHFPEKRDRVLGRIRGVRSGRLDDSRFGSRMTGEGRLAEQTAQLFRVARNRAGLEADGPALSVAAFRRPSGPQLDLFAVTGSD
jgi:DNA repair photolyase